MPEVPKQYKDAAAQFLKVKPAEVNCAQKQGKWKCCLESNAKQCWEEKSRGPKQDASGTVALGMRP